MRGDDSESGHIDGNDEIPASSPAALSEDALYGSFTPPHEEIMPSELLRADRAHLAQLSTANPTTAYYVRYRKESQVRYGVLEGETIHELNTHYFADPRRTGRRDLLEAVRLLAPLDPNRVSKVVGVALNTIGPKLDDVPPGYHPRWFSKLPTAITGPGGGVEVPGEASNFVHEAELVLVIGRRGRHLSVEEAPGYVWGVTVGNDMTELSWNGEGEGPKTPPKLMAKGSDTFAPLGPAIAVGLDYSNLRTTHRLNGELTQDGSSAARVQGTAELVSHLSRFMTLLPGDVIFTGAAPFQPKAKKVVRPGDELEAEVEGIGILRNRAVPMGGSPWGFRR